MIEHLPTMYRYRFSADVHFRAPNFEAAHEHVRLLLGKILHSYRSAADPSLGSGALEPAPGEYVTLLQMGVDPG